MYYCFQSYLKWSNSLFRIFCSEIDHVRVSHQLLNLFELVYRGYFLFSLMMLVLLIFLLWDLDSRVLYTVTGSIKFNVLPSRPSRTDQTLSLRQDLVAFFFLQYLDQHPPLLEMVQREFLMLIQRIIYNGNVPCWLS